MGWVAVAVATPYGFNLQATVVPGDAKTVFHSDVVSKSCTAVNSKRYSREPPAAASAKVTKSESASPDVITARLTWAVYSVVPTLFFSDRVPSAAIWLFLFSGSLVEPHRNHAAGRRSD